MVRDGVIEQPRALLHVLREVGTECDDQRPQPMVITALIIGTLALLFVLSGVLPTYRKWAARGPRVEEFESHYRAYLEAREKDYQQ
jgi:hypothetical protein